MSELMPATEQPRPGQVLAAARAEHKLSVADVSQQIKFGVNQIAAIEADDYARLPGTTFVRGMIRSYAKLVQVDPEPLLAGLSPRQLPGVIAVDLRGSVHEPFIEGGAKSNRLYVLLSLAALLAVAVVVYEWQVSPIDTGEVVIIAPRAAPGDAADAAAPAPGQAIAPSAPAPEAASAAPPSAVADVQAPVQALTAAAASPAKAGAAGAKRIELEFDGLSWVEIKQANGKVLLSQLNPAGSRQLIEGAPPFELVIGNAARVRLKYNDVAVDLRPYFKVDVARMTLE
jgi:cytoskeleton protein RodZ